MVLGGCMWGGSCVGGQLVYVDGCMGLTLCLASCVYRIVSLLTCRGCIFQLFSCRGSSCLVV